MRAAERPRHLRTAIGRRTRLALASLALAVLPACKVDVSVGIDAGADGTGEISVTALLDRAAAEEAGDLSSLLRTDDLKRAGWTVEAPERRSDGSVSLTVRRPFDGHAEAADVLEDLAGEGGPFERFQVDQRRSFFRTETSFSGAVDLTDGLEAFSDPALQEAFGGQPLGAPIEQLERRLGAPVGEIFGLQVAVRLPGTVTSNAPGDTGEDGDGASWTPELGERLTLSAEAEQWNVRNIALLVVTVGSAIAAVGLVLRTRGGARRETDVTAPRA